VVADLDVKFSEVRMGLPARNTTTDNIVTIHIEVLRCVENGLLPVSWLTVGRSCQGNSPLEIIELTIEPGNNPVHSVAVLCLELVLDRKLNITRLHFRQINLKNLGRSADDRVL